MRLTVITDVSDDSKLMQEEIFGPVVCIVPFSTEEEVKYRHPIRLVFFWCFCVKLIYENECNFIMRDF